MIESKLFFGKSKEMIVDDKKRVVVPSDIREVVNERQEGVQDKFKDILFLSNVGDTYVCFVANDYLKRYEEMLKKSWTDKERLAFFSAEIQKIDAQGRIRVPSLYEGAKKVVYTPNGDCFNMDQVRD